jgi:hypothetical protein
VQDVLQNRGNFLATSLSAQRECQINAGFSGRRAKFEDVSPERDRAWRARFIRSVRFMAWGASHARRSDVPDLE